LKILYIISNLGNGGAELSLKRLAIFLSKNKVYEIKVVSLSTKGNIAEELEKHGIAVDVINFSGILIPLSIIRLFIYIKNFNPNIIHTWMYHADLIGGILGKIAGVNKIYWSIRNTDIPQGKFSTTSFIRFINAIISSYIPNLIICNSQSGLMSHKYLGFCSKKMIVIPNSYVFQKYSTEYSKEEFITKFKLSDKNIIIAGIGRFDKLKDFKNFITASKKVTDIFPNTRYLLIGKNMDYKNTTLINWIKEYNTLENFILLGHRNDINFFLQEIIDIFCLSSESEGFPNVLIEAMASEVPCVVTNVGDVKLILENNGIVVPPKNSEALAIGLIKMIQTPLYIKIQYGKNNKSIVNTKYSIENIIYLYNKLYLDKN
jgi:glycosyltransferase involved in cell wall biosynthesis